LEAARKYKIDIPLVDQTMVQILLSRELPAIARVKAGETIYRREGAIAPSSVSVNAKAGAQAVAQNQLTAKRLYLPEWRKEAIRRVEADDERSQSGILVPTGK
jgi:hypothetical protein